MILIYFNGTKHSESRQNLSPASYFPLNHIMVSYSIVFYICVKASSGHRFIQIGYDLSEPGPKKSYHSFQCRVWF